ncbi:MAG: hypothetical protein ACR2HQ_11175 [Ilumatobacteraceae bacterium]
MSCGRGGEQERDFAFGVVRQLFEPAIATRDVTTDLTSLFSGAAHAARAVFELSPDDDDDDDDDDADPSFASMHGLYWLTVNLSVDDDRGAAREFDGRLGLLAAIDALIAGAVPGLPGRDQSDTTRSLP